MKMSGYNPFPVMSNRFLLFVVEFSLGKRG